MNVSVITKVTFSGLWDDEVHAHPWDPGDSGKGPRHRLIDVVVVIDGDEGWANVSARGRRYRKDGTLGEGVFHLHALADDDALDWTVRARQRLADFV